jgi:hypothetical protein
MNMMLKSGTALAASTAVAVAAPTISSAATVLPADSREAMVARAEQLVEVLGTCFVREGWKFDAERGAQFVESVRTFDENDGNCPKFEMVLDWMHDHGQSLDWLADGDAAGLITCRAATRATVGAGIDAELIALGERLKEVSDEAEKRRPDADLHEECWEAADFERANEAGENAAGHARFKAMADKNGYKAACDKWQAVCKVEHQIASAIFKMPANTRIGEGVRAAAALTLNDDVENLNEIGEVLWTMAARAGFMPPASIAKKLKRQGVSVSQRSRDTKLVRARAQMVDADRTIDALLENRQDRDADCEDVPGFLEHSRRRNKALAALAKSPARSLEGIIAKAQAVADTRHAAIATSLAADILRYCGHVA